MFPVACYDYYNISALCMLAVPVASAEEERLWNVISANSLDFDAWVALIDETEKVSEVLASHFLLIFSS